MEMVEKFQDAGSSFNWNLPEQRLNALLEWHRRQEILKENEEL